MKDSQIDFVCPAPVAAAPAGMFAAPPAPATAVPSGLTAIARATSVITPISGTASLIARVARWASPSGFQASAPSRLFTATGVTGNRAMAGIPRSASWRASSHSRSTVMRSTPGMEGTASVWFSPSRTNTG